MNRAQIGRIRFECDLQIDASRTAFGHAGISLEDTQVRTFPELMVRAVLPNGESINDVTDHVAFELDPLSVPYVTPRETFIDR